MLYGVPIRVRRVAIPQPLPRGKSRIRRRRRRAAVLARQQDRWRAENTAAGRCRTPEERAVARVRSRAPRRCIRPASRRSDAGSNAATSIALPPRATPACWSSRCSGPSPASPGRRARAASLQWASARRDNASGTDRSNRSSGGAGWLRRRTGCNAATLSCASRRQPSARRTSSPKRCSGAAEPSTSPEQRF